MAILALVIALTAMTVPANADHTAGDVWDVDQSAYPDDSACTPAERHCHTIQAAIDNASRGDVIMVSAGTYEEDLVIEKMLDVFGAQVDVDPRPSEGGRSGDESIIQSDGTAVFISDSNFVRFNGFTIESHVNDAATPVIKVNGTSIPRIAYNIIHNVNQSAESGDAIRIQDTNGTGYTVDHNHIHDLPGPGAAVRAHMTSFGNISYNEITNIKTEVGAIYSTDSTEPIARANQLDTIEGPGVVFGNHTGADSFMDMDPSHGYIIANTIQNTTDQSILVQMDDINVLRNVVLDSSSDAGAIHLQVASPGLAIIPEPLSRIDNIRIERNCVYDNALGIGVESSVNGSSVEIHQNNIVGNDAFGVKSETIDPVDARENWWGHASGPSGEGPGSGDAVSQNVLFEPWLTGQALDTACTPPPPCRSPESVEARAQNNGDIRVAWSAVSDADEYNIYRAEGRGEFTLLDSVDDNITEYSDSDTQIGKTYRYRVTAVIDGNESDHCDTAAATAIPVFPTVVAGGLAVLLGIGAYVAFNRRRGAA